MQFSTACNDGFFNGGSPFAMLINLHNVDDKAIVPAWLQKEPKIYYQLVENQLALTVKLHSDKSGSQAAEYALKYGFKPVQKTLSDTDSLLEALGYL